MAMLMPGSAFRPSRAVLPPLIVGLIAALLIGQGVRLLWALVAPLSPLGAWQPQAAAIASPAERRALFASIDPFFRRGGPGPASATVTALGLTLYGVNINEATGKGSAIIAGEDGVQTSHAVGDEIVPGVVLAGVAFDHVLLDRGGARETLFLDQSGEAPVAAPPQPVAAADPDASGDLSPAALKAGIAFAPRSEGGRVTGLSVQPQGDGSVFRAAGLRPGDVIRGVGGRPIASAGDAAALANQFTPGARLSLEVERGAAIVPIAIFLSKP